MDEFIVRALLGGIGIAILCGPLGCLVVWQRMAFFGAALSHAALLGIALGLFLNFHLYYSVLGVCLIFACLLMAMSKFKNLTSDTVLGILAHSSLALGIIVLGLLPSVRMDLMAYLFGDILAIQWHDITMIYLGGLVAGMLLKKIWNPLLSLIIQRDLALVDGLNEQNLKLIFMIILSFVVAISIQIVGVLLVVSMLVIPAACARPFSQTPERMAVLAAIFGCLAVIFGLLLSLMFDTAAGPSIVVSASLLFILSSLSEFFISRSTTFTR